ncbi:MULTISPECIES: hypothetical protein [Bacillus]|uniref:Uncharacterized protein n=1 Tax=Bacillus anthracis TaxID=1392 RepID=A0A0J1KL16_BACAN|nr:MULTISPECIES: hypothetical protein [Bacillus]EDX66442.1 hypothetical protein BC059799_0478 [Bacillus cereus NVH0597-99]MRB24447.1 hypothetical protein [Bacillus thuringiensis]KLV17340.1 hypothetical protein ABW01_17225 [Bacillus anthracis]MCU4797669.1 hypothetical protein [Bacillus cereus]MCU5532898.1 hypothetical protein [Bacillus cereus]
MEIKSYKDAEGNRVRLGDTIEITYSVSPEENRIAKVVEMKKEGHWVWVRLEGDKLAWHWGTKWTRLVARADKVKK